MSLPKFQLMASYLKFSETGHFTALSSITKCGSANLSCFSFPLLLQARPSNLQRVYPTLPLWVKMAMSSLPAVVYDLLQLQSALPNFPENVLLATFAVVPRSAVRRNAAKTLPSSAARADVIDR